MREFSEARNAEIHASMELVALVAVRNQEIDVLEARSAARRLRELAETSNSEIEFVSRASADERLREFAEARNAEINASIDQVAFNAARNAEIEAGMAAVAASRQIAANGIAGILIETSSIPACR